MANTYRDATRRLPSDAYLSTTFGNPGEGGYSEYWRTPDGTRYHISNGAYDLLPSQFHWRCDRA